MNYKIEFNSKSKKFLKNIDNSLAIRIIEKIELLKENPFRYLEHYEGEIPGKNKFTWNYRGHANLEVFDDEVLVERFKFLKARFNGKDVQAMIPFTDQASIENALICWASLLAMGYETDEVVKRLEKLISVGMRLELKNGINNCSVIDDSYSLDLSSLAIALDFLKQQNQHQRRTLILSDIPGNDSEAVYNQVRHLLENKSVDRLIAVGEHIGKYLTNYSIETENFASTVDLLEHFNSLKFQNETILLKGARSFEFERISECQRAAFNERARSARLTTHQLYDLLSGRIQIELSAALGTLKRAVCDNRQTDRQRARASES
jgi:alanine racemase